MRALFRGLTRFERDPKTLEEQIVHDAVRLESLGATGIARLLLAGYRERQDFEEIAAAIEEQPGVALAPRRAGGSPSRGARRCGTSPGGSARKWASLAPEEPAGGAVPPGS